MTERTKKTEKKSGEERRGWIDLRGVCLIGATIGELETIQSMLGGEVTIECDFEAGKMTIRKAGVSRLEMAETIEGVTGITIQGLEELRDTPLKQRQERYPFGRHTRTRESRRSKVFA